MFYVLIFIDRINVIFYMPSDEIENVLILQGGGSLGAFACSVFKVRCPLTGIQQPLHETMWSTTSRSIG